MLERIEKLLAFLLVFMFFVVCFQLQGNAESDAQVGVTYGPAYWPYSTTNNDAQQKSLQFDIKAASAEIRTVTVDIRGWKKGMLQIASGHVGASTFSTSGSMEATAYAWAEFKPGSSGDIVAMASMPIRAASSSLVDGATDAVQVKGNYYFDTNGASWMILRMFGNATTDKQLTLSLRK